MPERPREDRDTAAPLVLVAVLLVIIATGLIVLQGSILRAAERPSTWLFRPAG